MGFNKNCKPNAKTIERPSNVQDSDLMGTTHIASDILALF